MNITWRHDRADPLGPVDDAFPGGRRLLDPASIASALGVAATGHLRDVHYYPGRQLRTVHRLADGRIVSVDAVPVGEPLLSGPGQRVLPGLRALARVFPDDAGLAQLPAVVDELGSGAELFSWLPGRRAVLADTTRVARIDSTIDVLTAHRRHLELSRAVRQVSVPTPTLVDARGGVRWESRIDGVPIEGNDLPLDVLAGMVARAASGMHRCLPWMTPGLLADRGSAPLLARLRRKTQRTVGRALPALADRFGALVDSLERSRPQPGPSVLVHGDLHIANALLTDSGMLLLDIDEMGSGEPELDLAMFASRMLLIALHRGVGLDQAARFTALLPEVYTETADRPIAVSTYAWYVAAMLAGRQVKTSVRHLAPELEPLCDQLIGMAEGTLAAGRFDIDSVRYPRTALPIAASVA
jgi:Phosphotransferase enzyme family